MELIMQTVGVMAVMVAVIFAAYFLTKYIAVKANGTRGKTRNFTMIDRFSVAKDKMFVLFSVDQTVYLVGITNQNMTVIDQKKLSEFSGADACPERPQKGFPNGSFPRFRDAGHTGEKERGSMELFSSFMRRAGQADDEDKA